jgi:hypothetical protein
LVVAATQGLDVQEHIHLLLKQVQLAFQPPQGLLRPCDIGKSEQAHRGHNARKDDIVAQLQDSKLWRHNKSR